MTSSTINSSTPLYNPYTAFSLSATQNSANDPTPLQNSSTSRLSSLVSEEHVSSFSQRMHRLLSTLQLHWHQPTFTYCRVRTLLFLFYPLYLLVKLLLSLPLLNRFLTDETVRLPGNLDPFCTVRCETLRPSLLRDQTPSGYRRMAPTSIRPIGSIPQEEALLVPENAAAVDFRTFFQNLAVTIISDGEEATPFTQIRESEARAYALLYQKIATRETPIKIWGDDAFKAEILQAIHKLLKCPSGRLLILTLTRLQGDIAIVRAPASSPEDCNKIYAQRTIAFKHPSLDYEQLSLTVNQQEARLQLSQQPFHLHFAHELIHALHYIHLNQLSDYQALLYTYFLEAAPDDRNYSSFEEQLTICGIENSDFLCENTLRYELQAPPRYGSLSSSGYLHCAQIPFRGPARFQHFIPNYTQTP